MARVYLSGPITGHDDFLINFSLAKAKLMERGYEVVNPAQACLSLPRSFEHEDFMKVCMALLSCCDIIYMLHGWDTSIGAKAELEWAMFHGLGIMSEDKDG